MIDCSRNGVMTVSAIKRYADLLAKMGYNVIMLYTEDTYEVNGEPYFGYLRGRYTKEELKEIDRYCVKLGIELIPCIQTLAHLNAIFKWQKYQSIRDCDDVLLVGEQKTYDLIESIFATISECFTSRKIHIGMDEAYKVGLGKYLQNNGYRKRFSVINEHLHKVCEIAKKYNFSPMIWSDMFCKLAANSENYYDCDVNAIKKVCKKAKLPEDVSLVYWDYYSTDCEHYVKMLQLNKAFNKDVYFAGGAWTWRGIAPDNSFSMQTIFAAMQAIKQTGVSGWFMTLWGDDGNECSPFTLLPSMLYAIEIAKGNADINDIKRKFKLITGLDFDVVLTLDKLDKPSELHTENPSKYLLYNDPFLGINDYRCSLQDETYYSDLTNQIERLKYPDEYAVYFEAYKKLSDALSVKCSLGIRTRKAYKIGDISALTQLIDRYDLSIEKIKAFHYAYEKYWLNDKKPQGFEVQDIRLGGLIQRLTTCKRRLIDYIQGFTESIPELEEEILIGDCGGNSWSKIVTPSVI